VFGRTPLVCTLVTMHRLRRRLGPTWEVTVAQCKSLLSRWGTRSKSRTRTRARDLTSRPGFQLRCNSNLDVTHSQPGPVPASLRSRSSPGQPSRARWYARLSHRPAAARARNRSAWPVSRGPRY
jgi:hypothetical protein